LLDYPVYVAPAMLGVAAMTGSVTETTYNVFGKMKFMKLYDAVLATPVTPTGVALGEIGWAVSRSGFYAAAFVAIMSVMGLAPSWWTLAAVPAAVLAGCAFSAFGMACSTYLRSWQDFDYITLSIFVLFLFSGTFAPIEVYPPAMQKVITLTPLYHAVELLRGLTTGSVSASLLWHVGYLVALTVAGVAIAATRMRRRLTP
ncbi:MAG: ABC transporter permease, partial [Micromonosporaceae bacterium]